MHINSTAEEFFFRCFAYQRNTPALDKTIIWSYNALGNRTEAREYAYTTATSPTGGTTTVFMHQNGWGNQVTIISQGTTTKTISYDNAGNPTNYKGATLTWTRGRLLASYKPSGSSYTTTMQYDANGVRCSKTIPTSTQPNVFRYVYDGNNLVRETKSGTSSYTKTFLYNSQGIVGFAIGSTVYTYRKNLFGDIIAIYQGATKKAAYVYDAWGNCTITQDTDGVGTANPFRYRSYYWDNDLQLYYLMSRYYDPATGRFINADSLEYLDPETIGGLNLYSYCGNNPVMHTDPMGTFGFWALFAITLAGFIIGGTSQLISNSLSGKKGDELWRGVLGSALGTATNALLLCVTMPLGGASLFISAAAGSAVQTSVDELEKLVRKEQFDPYSMGESFLINFLIMSIGNFMGANGVPINSGWFQPVKFMSVFTKSYGQKIILQTLIGGLISGIYNFINNFDIHEWLKKLIK